MAGMKEFKHLSYASSLCGKCTEVCPVDAIHQGDDMYYIDPDVCIDCAQTPDGQLLVFEIDHAMVVHAMDLETQFPYKQVHMLKVKNAFRDYLFRLSAAQPLKDR